MSITSHLNRILADRNTIRDKLVEMGLATSSDTLDTLAQIIEGLVDQGAVSLEVKEGQTVVIPAGFHNGGGTVVGISGGGSYTLQSKNVTPTKKQQSIAPDSGYYGLSGVVVAAIPAAYQDVSAVTLTAENALAGMVFVTADGSVVTGTMVDNGAVAKTLDVTTISYTIPKGFHSGSGAVKIVLETKSVTPTKSAQTVTPTAGKVLSQVTVEAIPDKYQDVSGVTATGADTLEGKIIVDAEGNKLAGEIPNNGDTSATIDGLTVTSVAIPEGYTTGGTVSLTGDIEAALAAI